MSIILELLFLLPKSKLNAFFKTKFCSKLKMFCSKMSCPTQSIKLNWRDLRTNVSLIDWIRRKPCSFFYNQNARTHNVMTQENAWHICAILKRISHFLHYGVIFWCIMSLWYFSKQRLRFLEIYALVFWKYFSCFCF